MNKSLHFRRSLLPTTGGNKFQEIKRKSAIAEAEGIKLIKLSIGQPSGPALLGAREAAAEAVMSGEESMHEYQDNGSPGVKDFARRFVGCHVDRSILDRPDIGFLPIPGIKPMLDYVVKSLGSWTADRRVAKVGTMTDPGYSTPADACVMAKGIKHFHLELKPKNGFLFGTDGLGCLSEGDMLMLNFPHNPTGIIAESDWLRGVCAYCEKRGIRIFNDAAYAKLSHSSSSVTLTQTAVEFPGLNWTEAFSASKLGNNTGWRIGAMVGSSEFIGDIARIKGNMDSGFVAPMAAGIIHLLEDHSDQVEQVRALYEHRLDYMEEILTECSMKVSVCPQAGFFILCDSPNAAFGQEIADAEAFNNLMIERTGLVGVPFGKYIRYAVCTADIIGLRSEITGALEKAEVMY